MLNSDKIYIAGHKGLVGSAITRKLQEKNYSNLVFKTHSELDLTDKDQVDRFFSQEKPMYVILAAAKVGGIMANNTYRADFILDNLQIQNNVIQSAWKYNVKKLLFLGSSCIYPKEAPQPINEDALLTGPLEYTNEPYAIAKIAGIKLCESFNIQYKTDFISVMPTNLYGPNDNYHLEKSHVLPALIRKMHLAKSLMEKNWDAIRSDLQKRPSDGISYNADEDKLLEWLGKWGISENGDLQLWGSGNPYREFMHSDDMADACIYIMENISFSDLIGDPAEIRNTHINIGTGVDLRIKGLAELIKSITGYKGSISWDTSKPDGTFRKLLNVKKLNDLGWKANISLEEGISRVYQEYIAEQD